MNTKIESLLLFIAILTFGLSAQAASTATAVAEVKNGSIVNVRLIDNGSGYSESPKITLVGGGGSGGIVRAEGLYHGVVAGLDIVNGGKGYTEPPQVIIQSPYAIYGAALKNNAKYAGLLCLLCAVVAIGYFAKKFKFTGKVANKKLVISKQAISIGVAIAVIGLVILGAVQTHEKETQRFNSDVTVEGKMPTKNEAIKWALLTANSKYSTFGIVSTNLTQVAEDHTWILDRGIVQDTIDMQAFGAAYGAIDAGKRFTRTETNWVCDLTVTHTKLKPDSEVSTLFTDWTTKDASEDDLLSELKSKLDNKYTSYDVVKKYYYQVDRPVGGQVTQLEDTWGEGNTVVKGRFWDYKERDKWYIKPTRVLIVEVKHLVPISK